MWQIKIQALRNCKTRIQTACKCYCRVLTSLKDSPAAPDIPKDESNFASFIMQIVKGAKIHITIFFCSVAPFFFSVRWNTMYIYVNLSQLMALSVKPNHSHTHTQNRRKTRTRKPFIIYVYLTLAGWDICVFFFVKVSTAQLIAKLFRRSLSSAKVSQSSSIH